MLWMSILLIIAIFSAIYCYHFFELEKKSWEFAQYEEETRERYDAKYQETGHQKGRWLFLGPGCSIEQDIHLRMATYPAMTVRLTVLTWVKMPIFLAKLFYNRLTTGNWEYAIKDKQLFDIVVESPLLIAAKLEGDSLTMKIPDNLPLKTLTGLKPAGLEIEFKVSDESIVRASWQGKDLTGNNNLLATLLIKANITWSHTQSHVLSEKSAREIALKKVDALEPSHRFVNALHDGLFYCTVSPLKDEHPMYIRVDRQSVIDSLAIPLHHEFDPAKSQFFYYDFIWRSRIALAKTLEKHNIDVEVEFLFHNMIVHSADHFIFYHTAKRIPWWSIDGDKRLLSYISSFIFRESWILDKECPMSRQRIKRISAKKFPFYRDLYNELAKIDKRIADNILCSTSF